MKMLFEIIDKILVFFTVDELSVLLQVNKAFNSQIKNLKFLKKIIWRCDLTKRNRLQYWIFKLNISQTIAETFKKFPEIPQSSFYSSVLQIQNSTENDSVKNSISKDVSRTHLLSGEQQGIELSNILLAFAYIKPHIGYCQGLNFVAAMLLQIALKEELAFWMLTGLVEKRHMENLYVPGVPDLALREYQLNHYFQAILPDLYAHFRKIGVTSAFFISRWFMTIFSTYLPYETLLPIWDCFLVEGWKVVMKVSILLLKQIRTTFLQWDLDQISKHLRRHIIETSASEILAGAKAVKITSFELDQLENEFYKNQVKFKLEASELSHVPSEDDIDTIRWGKTELENFDETIQQDIQTFQRKIEKLDHEIETFSKHYLQITMEYSQVSKELENLIEKKSFYEKMLKNMKEKQKQNKFPKFIQRFIRLKSMDSSSTESDITKEDILVCQEKIKLLEKDEQDLRNQWSEKNSIYKDALSKAYDLNDRKKKYSGQLCDFLNLIK